MPADSPKPTPAAPPLPQTGPAAEKPKMPEKPAVTQAQAPGEQGGPKGLEPTRYGDWERKGIVSDF
jgi:hypothetical protein